MVFYKLEEKRLKKEATHLEHYRFSDGNFFQILSKRKGEENYYWEGLVDPAALKDKIGEDNYSKFLEGQRDFQIK